MKKSLIVILSLVLCCILLVGCKSETDEPVTQNEEIDNVSVINPLPQTIDVNTLDNATVAVSFDKGDAYVDDTGKMVIDLTVYAYDFYDMVDIATLKENDAIVRRNEEIKITEIEKLDTGLVIINGGEENGGFTLTTDDNTVYYEIGMSDRKNYYEIGDLTLRVSTEFRFLDSSELDAEAKMYYPGDFLTDDAGIEYNFNPYNTTVVIENGFVIEMNRVYVP